MTTSDRLAGDLAVLPQRAVVDGDRTSPRSGDWDRLVARVGGDVVQTTAWAAAKRALGFETVEVVCRGADGALIGGAQLVVKRLFGPAAVGYVARGPLLCRDDLDRADLVLGDIERAARARSVQHLIVQPAQGHPALEAALGARGYLRGGQEVAPTATVLLDLQQDLEALQSGMSESRRRQRRQAVRSGLEAVLGTRDDLESFRELHAATAAVQGFQPVSLAYLTAHWDALGTLNAVALVLIRDAGRPVAGILLTTFEGTVTFRLAGWNRACPAAHPNVAAHWFAIRWAKERGFHTYDLGGLPRRYAETLLAGTRVPDDMRQSAARFKVAFGGTPVLLPEPWHRTFNPIVRGVVRTIGPRVARSRLWRSLANRARGG